MRGVAVHTLQTGSPGSEDLVGLMLEATGLAHRIGMGASLALMHDAGLTVAQYVALHVLGARGPRTMGELAARIRLSRPATTQLVDRLVQLGFLVRLEGVEDRRQRLVAISEGGRDLLRRIRQERVGGLEAALERLPPPTQASLAGCLRELVGHLQAVGEPADQDQGCALDAAGEGR